MPILAEASSPLAAMTWVKYGRRTINVGELRPAPQTPSNALSELNRLLSTSESTAASDDAATVANAVQALELQVACGRGPIKHRFFFDWTSAITYGAVADSELHWQSHINAVLALRDFSDRIDFTDEALCLCVCDINSRNFRKDRCMKIATLDFRATCLLPSSFFAFAVPEGSTFAQSVAKHLRYSYSKTIMG
ncbi:hypothetical protein BC827DRAFT_1158187 [Russula dissimulans]|nr:hypothetical protein BC827DRAFT_1158187 [Russula dissimulans]